MLNSKLTIVLASFLLSAGCGASPEGALAEAAAQGNLAEIERLMAAGAEKREMDSALIWAARSGQPAAIDLLADRGANPNATGGVNGWTVMMHAIHKDQPQSVLALVKRGADVNAQVRNGLTALVMAAGYGYTNIVRILLDSGAVAQPAALDAALNGVGDIDRFTLGTCQADTVKLLRERAPELKPADAGKLQSCHI